MMPTISPYKASASAKIRIRIIPTNSFGCCAFALYTISFSKSVKITHKPYSAPENLMSNTEKTVLFK
jgi:hypothetical protein